MRIRCALLACAIVGLLQYASVVQAQYNSALSYGGMPSGAASGRQGIFGNRSGSSSRPGQGTLGAGNAFNSQNDLSSARFVRGNRQPNDFVGGSAQDAQHFVGGAPEGASAGNWSPSGGSMSPWTPGGGFPGSRQNANRNQQGAEGNAEPTAASIRTTFRAAFDHPEPDAEQLSTSLALRLAKTSAIQTRTPIRVELQGRTAILRGAVSTEHDRDLAEQMIRLEAGIQAVKNEIVVGSPTSAAPMPP
jgi:hypothetical protein